MTWDPRPVQRRYRCEWCDHPVAPDELLCEDCCRTVSGDCASAELNRQLEEEGT